MKINTKTVTPIKTCPTSKIADNKDLPTAPTEQGSLGRVLTFIPMMIWTPVLSSKRTEVSTPASPRLTGDEMKEVCVLLSELFISKTTDKKDQPAEDRKPELGRFKTTIMDPKTNQAVPVLRSVRVQA